MATDKGQRYRFVIIIKKTWSPYFFLISDAVSFS